MKNKAAAAFVALTSIKMNLARVGVAAAVACSLASHAATDTDVLLAKEAAQRGQWKKLDELRPRFVGHILEAYPSFWLLSGSVERADPAEVRAFLERYPGTPLAESLRREWLKALGAQGAWDLFRTELRLVVGEDAEISCYAFRERLARADPEVAAEARNYFLAATDAPAACDPVFNALLASHALSEDDVWLRLHKVLANVNVREARRTNALLAPTHRLRDKSLDQAAADPAKFLAREKAPLFLRSTRETVFFAIARLARRNSEDAAERIGIFAARLGPDLTAAAWGQVAWQAALDHDPRALDWYALAGETPLTDAQVAWRARAALRASDWKQLLAAIQAMAPEQARDVSWRYWRARALRNLGEAEAANALLRGVAGELNFYGLLAADELGIPPHPDWNPKPLEPAELERMRSQPGIQRALALYAAGLDNEALREWLWAIRGLPDRDLIAAAEIAREANVTDRAINTADRTAQLHDFARRYPMMHRDALDAATRQFAVDEALVFSLIRQESRFVAEARSRAGAMGLMQLMPATARWVARQIPVHPFSVDMLARPDVNILMGSYYFSRVLTSLGHPILATAAYNAGPGRARRWRDERPLEGAIYTETIPFNETRDYVKKVFTNAWFYRNRLTGQVPSMRELVGLVPGRNGEAALPLASTEIP